ncbi:MFS transporter [Brevibacillus fulvus]|uniref:MFS family arabinose efflux permease n=1 Tax=Brevibacillus fulvus TaxID=1125967 RepID=A0A939BTD7_9BACL|nr:MFS transporter [Brevibacillus fulvus]MBM7591408.1 putative MFS family arabinose efflux permease [Brevibacillus fulvus]
MEKPALWNKDFLKMCFSNFFIFMTFYTLATTLPVYTITDLHGNQSQVGLLMTAFIIAGVILRPLAGQWVDRLSKRKVVLIALLFFFIASVAYLGTSSFLLLLLLRVFHGAAFGASSTTTGAVAAELIPVERKGEGISYFSLFMSLAMVLGPFIGLTVIDQFNFTVLFALCAVFSLLALLSGGTAKFPPTSREQESMHAKRLNWRNFVEPKAVPISLTGLILAIAYSGITTFISIYANELGLGKIASYFFIFFALLVVLPRPLVGRVLDRYNEHVLVYPGIALFAVGMVMLSSAHTATIFLLSGAIIGLGYGALIPCFQTLAIKLSPDNRKGVATSTYFSLYDLGFGIGSYVLGVIATHSNYHTMFFTSAIVVAFTAPAYFILHHRKHRQPPSHVQVKGQQSVH